MRSRTKKACALVLGGALALGASIVAAGAARAGEPDARDPDARAQVEQLLPRLWSDDDSVRERAESELFALGDAGRHEMERLARDTDTRRAVTALRLLQSDRWDGARADVRSGEQPLRRIGAPERNLDDVEREMRTRIDELRRRLDEAFGAGRAWRLPELPALPRIEWRGTDQDAQVSVHGQVLRDGRELTWDRGTDGKVRVTVKDDGDQDAHVYEAENLDAFRSAHPDVAAQLDALVPSWTGGPALRLVPHQLDWPHGLAGLFGDGPAARDPDGDDGARAPADGAERLRERAAPPERGPALGIEFDLPGDVLREQLELGDAGLVVRRVVPGTLAERVGLRPHDIVTRIGGTEVRDAGDVRSALAARAEDGPVEVEVVRRARRLTLSGR